MNRITFGLVGILALAAGHALGAGMLIPKDESIPPLAIESQRVDIQIKDGVATARIEQVFRNSVNRDLEAIYVFPLPEEATISDFAIRRSPFSSPTGVPPLAKPPLTPF